MPPCNTIPPVSSPVAPSNPIPPVSGLSPPCNPIPPALGLGHNVSFTTSKMQAPTLTAVLCLLLCLLCRAGEAEPEASGKGPVFSLHRRGNSEEVRRETRRRMLQAEPPETSQAPVTSQTSGTSQPPVTSEPPRTSDPPVASAPSNSPVASGPDAGPLFSLYEWGYPKDVCEKEPTRLLRAEDLRQGPALQWVPVKGRYLIPLCNLGRLSNVVSCSHSCS